jgi:hypothetical protein
LNDCSITTTDEAIGKIVERERLPFPRQGTLKMGQMPTKHLTLAEFLQLPETESWFTLMGKIDETP